MEGSVEWPAKAGHGRNCFFEDLSGNLETFKSNANQMFISGDPIDIEACITNSSGCKAEIIRGLKGLELYMNDPENLQLTGNDISKSGARIFFIRQNHSRAPMQLSESAMKLILSRLKVFPGFINILSGFQLQTYRVLDGGLAASRFYCLGGQDSLGNSTFETAYILKHVEYNGRPGTSSKWSIRQMAVYQQYNNITKFSNCILVQTSTRVKFRIAELAKDGAMAELPNHWTHLHEVYLGTLSHNWDSHINDMNDSISAVKQDYLFTTLGAHNRKRVTFTSLQALSVFRDHSSVIVHALELNIEVLNRLSQEATRRALLEGKGLAGRYDQFQASLRTSIMEHSFLKQQTIQAGGIADRLAVHLRDTIALQDSDVMMTLNQKTIQEAQTMRTITLVALVYLPASFTATFLSMGFVHVESLSGVMRINVSQDMWFYLAITAPLMVVTFLIWWTWEWIIRRRRRAQSQTMQGYGDDGEKFKFV